MNEPQAIAKEGELHVPVSQDPGGHIGPIAGTVT